MFANQIQASINNSENSFLSLSLKTLMLGYFPDNIVCISSLRFANFVGDMQLITLTLT